VVHLSFKQVVKLGSTTGRVVGLMVLC